jgi:molybdopterin-guanine dinucleotide biosynthesis protein A
MDALMLMGEASRLKDKPFVSVAGKPLFRHGWDVLVGVFDNALISCVPSVEKKLKAFNIPYVLDEEEAGPLSGIRAGFRALSSDYVFVVGCDMPLIRADVIRHLIPYVKDDGLILQRDDGFTEPLHAFYAREKTLKTIKELLPEKRRMTDFIALLNIVRYPAGELRAYDSSPHFLSNVNTQKELDNLKLSFKLR